MAGRAFLAYPVSMIPYPELERALKRWKVRQAGGTAEESVTEVGAEAVVSAEVYSENTEERRAVEDSGLMPVAQFDRD
jgi:hypothetical protein